jgi:hypothetical protein
MLPVHFDLFLYVMRKRYNRLFLLKYQVEVRLFFHLHGKQRGVGDPIPWGSIVSGTLKRRCMDGLIKPVKMHQGTGRRKREKWHPGKSGYQLVS